MKKLLSVLLSAVIAASSLVCVSAGAETQAQEANAYTMPGWEINSLFASNVTRVYNASRDSWEARFTNTGNTGWTFFITYAIPADKYTPGRQYKISYYARTEGTEENYVVMNTNAEDDTNCYVPNFHNGGTLTKTASVNGLIRFGFTKAPQDSVAYIDDIVIEDAETGEKLNLPNLDFETDHSDYVQAANKYTMPGWDVLQNGYVQRVYNEERKSHEARIVSKGDNAEWQYYIQYQIPTDKFDSTHTYKVNAYLRAEGCTQGSSNEDWMLVNFIWGGKLEMPVVWQFLNGANFEMTGVDLNGHYVIQFGFRFSRAGNVMYVDDVVITDETTGEKLDLPNLDFETDNSDYVQDANEFSMPNWTINKSENVQRFYNADRKSWEAKITGAGSNAGWQYYIQYQIPTDKLDSTHTYSVEGYLRTDNTGSEDDWIAVYSIWGGNGTTLYVPQYYNGVSFKILTGVDLYNHPVVQFGLQIDKANVVMYVDDVKIYDETDKKYLDLPNLDFETAVPDGVTVAANDGGQAVATVISTKKSYDMYIVSAVYENVNGANTLKSVTRTKKNVKKSNEAQKFTIEPSIYPNCLTKVFVWDSDITPLSNVVTFTAVESAE